MRGEPAGAHPKMVVAGVRLRATPYGALVSATSLLRRRPRGCPELHESGDGETVAAHVARPRTAAPSAIEDVQVGAGHEAVETLKDVVAEEFPAASRATTPNVYDVPQARPD